MANDNGSPSGNERTFGGMRGKQPAARAARSGAQARNRPLQPLEIGRFASTYDDWTRGDLYERAKEMGIRGCSQMTKSELIRAIRSH